MSYVPAHKQYVAGTTTQVSIAPPPGSIMAWLGTWNSVTDDPDGWVVANGQTRNVGDSRYSKIVSIVGSGSANSYTPPDYRGAFLRGAGTNPSKSGYAGATVGSSQNHTTQVHSHTASQASHYHNTYQVNTLNGGNPSYNYKLGQIEGSGAGTLSLPGDSNFTSILITNTVTPSVTIDNSTTNVDNNETRPYNYSVNWIIKL